MPYWRLYYHIIWGTKNREPVVSETWEKELYGYLRGKSIALECIPHAINGMADHIHLVLSIPPKYPISSIVGKLKGSSSHFINRELEPSHSFAWQSSYGVISVSENRISKLVRYVQNQKHHHASGKIILKLEICTTSSPGAQPPGS